MKEALDTSEALSDCNYVCLRSGSSESLIIWGMGGGVESEKVQSAWLGRGRRAQILFGSVRRVVAQGQYKYMMSRAALALVRHLWHTVRRIESQRTRWDKVG